MGKPRLAFLIRKFPPIGGYRNRLLSQLDLFSRHFDIHLLVLSKEPLPSGLSKMAGHVRCISADRPCRAAMYMDKFRDFILDARPYFHGYSPIAELRRGFEDYLEANGIRLIWAFGSLAGTVAKTATADYKFIDFCDSNYISSLASGKPWHIGYFNKRFEKSLARHFDGISYISERDCRACGHPRQVTILPNLFEVPSLGTSQPERDLVMLGNWAYPPNADALSYAFEEIFPRAGRKLRIDIVGPRDGKKRELSGHDIRYLDYVSELVPALRDCKLMLAPVRFGSGTQQKVFDGLSAGLPVLVTPFVLSGMDYRGGCPGLVTCSSSQGFAAEAVRLLDDRAERERIGQEGRRWFEKKAADILMAYNDVIRTMKSSCP